MTNYEPYWICRGPKKRPHAEEEVERDERCPICGRDRATAEKENSPPLPLGQILGGVALVAALIAAMGLGSRYFFPKVISWVSRPETEEITETPNGRHPEDYTWEPQRFTKGQRTLFPEISNANRDNGIEELNQSNFNNNWDEAFKFFDKAVTADRNDPEVLIFKNNALARQKGNYLTLAAVVPVDSQGSSSQEMLRGIAMAQNEFNEDEGVNGQLLEIIIANDGNNPVNSKEVAQQLVNDRSILGVIGHNSSGASKAGLTIYKSKGLAMISPTSTSTDLKSKVFFRTVPSDEAAGKKLAKYLDTQYLDNGLKLEKVVIFNNPNDPYSKSLSAAFANNFSGSIVNKIDISVKDPDSMIINNEVYRSVLEKQAQAALLFPNTDLTSVAIEIAKVNDILPDKQKLKLFGGDALYSPRTLKAGGKAVEDIILVVPWIDKIPQSKEFKDASEKQWGGSVNWRTAMSYDATQAFIKAFSDNPNPTRSSIMKDLAQIQLSSSDTSGGEIKFTPDGEVRREPVLVKATRNAKNLPQGSEFGFALVE